MGKTKEITRQELDLVMAAVKKLFTRNSDGARDADELRSRFNYDHLGGCFGGMWRGMYIGIELDGHTHS
jgi:hypothetical protein|tara:strand:- start:198 stop:404 length:207 start_codon:yes stop_codon:yes gene_type:complete